MSEEKRLIREGVVTELDDTLMSARVTFEDKQDLVSDFLPIVGRGSSAKGWTDYWLPMVGETAVCLFAPNDEESGTGWILGTRYHEKSPPPKIGGRWLKFSDGTGVEYDTDTSTLNISVAGDMKISASGGVSIEVAGDLTIDVKGVVRINGAEVHIND